MVRRNALSEGRSLKKVMIIIVAVLLLGGAAAGAYFYQLQGSKKNADTAKTPDAATLAEEKKLQESLSGAKDSEAKAKAYQDLANHFANTDSKQKGIEYAQKAVDETQSATAYAQLGFNASQAGDKQKAITAYEKAASIASKTQVDDGRSDYSYYLMQARLLKEGKL